MSDRIPDGHLFLDADSLLSKWGFSDGSALFDWWWDRFDESPPFDDSDVLHALVLAYLLPALRDGGHSVEIMRIETSHNPVRAATLDGIEVDHYQNGQIQPPVWVTISPEQVDEIVARIVVSESSDPPPSETASQLERGLDAPTQDHTNGSGA